MTAKQILSLIESVDPSDTAKLDEIDLRVWHMIKRSDPKTIVIVRLDVALKSLGTSDAVRTPHYTRSRDALKAIRPKGARSASDFSVSKEEYPNYKGVFRILTGLGADYKCFNGHAITEELAELHAIIQAIEFERTPMKTGGDE